MVVKGGSCELYACTVSGKMMVLVSIRRFEFVSSISERVSQAEKESRRRRREWNPGRSYGNMTWHDGFDKNHWSKGVYMGVSSNSGLKKKNGNMAT